MQLSFHTEVEDEALLFAVICARYQGAWIFSKHKLRDTYELPGGHRELGESVLACAKRELYEETGAVCYHMVQVGIYSVIGKTRVKESRVDKPTYGGLFFAEVDTLHELPPSEIGCVTLFKERPEIDIWTYPQIQPILLDYVENWLHEHSQMNIM